MLAVPRPREEVCGGAKIFGSAFLQPARSVCVSSERFLISLLDSSFFLNLGIHHLCESNLTTALVAQGATLLECKTDLESTRESCNSRGVRKCQGWAQGSFVEAEAEVKAERSRQRRGKAEAEAEARQSEIDVVCVVLISCTMHV